MHTIEEVVLEILLSCEVVPRLDRRAGLFLAVCRVVLCATGKAKAFGDAVEYHTVVKGEAVVDGVSAV